MRFLAKPFFKKEIINFCCRSPALLIHLMDKFSQVACIESVREFCFDEIEAEIAAKLWAETFPFLQDLDINERLLLRSVGFDFQGVPRSALYNRRVFEGLYKHLEPFLRPIRTVSLEVDEAEGESASTPKEQHVYVAYVPFQAFVTSAISSSGVLAESPTLFRDTVKNDLFYHLFRSVMFDFGERLINEIDAGNANDAGSPLNKPLDDIVEQCKNAGLSLDDLKNCALCDYIEELEECGLRKVQGISVLKDHLLKKFNHRDVCRSIIVALKNALVHTATEREHVQKLLPLLPFRFFEALPLIQTACGDAKAIEPAEQARQSVGPYP